MPRVSHGRDHGVAVRRFAVWAAGVAVDLARLDAVEAALRALFVQEQMASRGNLERVGVVAHPRTVVRVSLFVQGGSRRKGCETDGQWGGPGV